MVDSADWEALGRRAAERALELGADGDRSSIHREATELLGVADTTRPLPARFLEYAAKYAVGFHSVGVDLELERSGGVGEGGGAEGASSESSGAAAAGGGGDRRPQLLVPKGPVVSAPPSDFELSIATEADAAAILALIIQLTVYEKEPLSSVLLDEARLRKDGFGPHPVFYVILATVPSSSALSEDAPACGSRPGRSVIGQALFHTAYSTWTGMGLYLEDLYVIPQARKFGIGTRLVSAVVTAARVLACPRVSWVVLDWNTPALNAYARLGALRMDEWVLMRLTVDTIPTLAGE
jgi:GNAT superfamily N-acetyltransferase